MCDYIITNRTHPKLSMEVLQGEKKTQLCIYNILHTDAWKHRLNCDRVAMEKCQKLAAIVMKQSKTYDKLLKTLWT